MPLEAHVPKLDDHTYDSIVAEMRSRISRYTPEWQPIWSDLNDSDPGITMLQVFAWLGEMLAYRMNQVPELNYLKFLQLLGVELRPAEPAQAQITFPMQDKAQTKGIVPKGTQVIAETEGGGTPLVFEADAALPVIRARHSSTLVAHADGSTETVVADQPFGPFGPLASTGAAVLLGFDDPDAFPATEFSLYAWAAAPARGAAVTCGLGGPVAFAPAIVTWSAWTALGWTPIALLKDETLAFTRSGSIVLRTPEGLIRAAQSSDPVERYWIRAQLEKAQYERVPQLRALRTNTMTLTQMETVTGEVLGGSTGRPNQTFRLASAPVIKGSLSLTVDQGSGAEEWTEVADLLGSGPRSTHFMLNRSTGEIRFGDGRRGAVPTANAANPGANVVARQYRYGGGSRGNVAARALRALRSSVPGIDDSAVVNVADSYGGRDEQGIDDAKQSAPAAIRSRARAVTPDDFEYFATQAANIARAKALPLRHPGYPEVAVPGAVTVIVVPDSADPTPQPSEGTLRTVCAFLDQRRLLTTELYVSPPDYQIVSTRVELAARTIADLAQVKRDVEAALLKYFHPLRGGESGQGWPFGGTISFSRVFQRVFSVAGVANVKRVVISLDGTEQPECQDVHLRPGALAASRVHDVSVTYETGGE